jgi:uncharacterized membrane protein
MMPAGSTVRRSGLLMAALALTATLIALYLAAVKLAGGTPACGVLAGCDTVNTSEYSEIMGIPVALFGTGASMVTLAASVVWWRGGSRRALLGAYVIGLAALPFLAYLTFLELFVIHAICIWCVAYAAAVVAGWLVATVVLTQTRAVGPD